MLFSTKIFPGYIKHIKVKTPITLRQVSFETNEQGEGDMEVFIASQSSTCSLLCKLSKTKPFFSFELNLAQNDVVKLQGNGDGFCCLLGNYINNENLQTAIISSTEAVAGQLMKPVVRTIWKTQNGCIYCDFVEGKGKRAEPKSEVFLQLRGIVPGQMKPFINNFGAQPCSFILGGGELIPGLDESLLGMKEGGYRNITVPSSQAFGVVGIPRLTIPPNADIQYEVILVKVLNPAGRFSRSFMFR